MLTADRFLRSGKVRDLFALPDRRLVLVASDRVSAFDVILPTTIPDKGRVLTGLSRYWFDETRAIVPNHLLDTDPDVIGDAFLAALEADATAPRAEWPDTFVFEEWRGRVMVCQPANVIPLEAVVRGYLSGSAWKEYRETGSVCGIQLPVGLRESDPLPAPIFTPAAKAPPGEHDENLTFDRAIDYVANHYFRSFLGDVDGPRLSDEQAGAFAEAVRDSALKLFRYGSAAAAKAGIVLADTKFEFGIPLPIELGTTPPGPREEWIERRRPLGGSYQFATGEHAPSELMLIDEILTPDSSRFWDAASYAPGGPQASFDKQFVRDWLERQPWDKTAPGPELPDEVVAGTRARYVEAYERITGGSFDRYLAEDVIGPARNMDEEAG
jgi:phosphoribosylaminoimidazole-succinocarboxamide synthase